MHSLVTPAISAIPVCGSTGVPLHAALGVQLMAQHGLVDDPGGLGFVIQRLGIDRHQLPVGAGLAVGDDDVGVQVRIPAPRRLVLIGDRHQPRQPLQVLHPGERVVHPGVSGVLVQIGHRRRRPPADARLRHRPFRRRRRSTPAAATHFWARRRSDRNRAHCPCVNARPAAPLGAIPSSSQRCATSGSAVPPSTARPSRPTSSAVRAASPAISHVGARVSPSE